METKHTSGKWKITRKSNYEITIKSNGIRICEVKSYSGAIFKDPSTEQRDYNAKLICAAPDLLNALNVYLMAGDKEARKKASAIAKKAIKKATE